MLWTGPAQYRIIDEILVLRHGLDHVCRLRPPVVFDVTHAEENLELLVRRMSGVSCRANPSKAQCDSSGASEPSWEIALGYRRMG
jgi:hypothetical protein